MVSEAENDPRRLSVTFLFGFQWLSTFQAGSPSRCNRPSASMVETVFKKDCSGHAETMKHLPKLPKAQVRLTLCLEIASREGAAAV
jgi:hypothetical protein